MRNKDDILQLKKPTVKFDDKDIVLKKSRGKNPLKGKGDLEDIEWFTYDIVGDIGLFDKYNKVAFMKLRITADMLKSFILANKYVTKISQIPRVNVDAKTGNIHPPKKDDIKFDKVRQLVLFNGSGPLTPQFIKNNDYYIYSAVHKACYYPLLDEKDTERFEKDNRYRFLKAVWEQIVENK